MLIILKTNIFLEQIIRSLYKKGKWQLSPNFHVVRNENILLWPITFGSRVGKFQAISDKQIKSIGMSKLLQNFLCLEHVMCSDIPNLVQY